MANPIGPDSFRYDDRHVLVVGGATGMGAAAAKLAKGLGAHVTVMDVAEVDYLADASIRVDLRDRASVDKSIASVSDPVDVVFSCAGVADGTPGVMLINFIAQRHLIETLLADGKLNSGGAVVMISSVAGLPWMRNLQQVLEFLDTPDWDGAAAWVAAHEGTDSYSFSKQAMNGYVAQRAFAFQQHGIRINAVLPAPTDTPLARANAAVWLGFGKDYRDAAKVEALQPEQVAGAMIFLGSRAASGVNGITLLIDNGHIGAGVTGAFEAPLIKALMGVS